MTKKRIALNKVTMQTFSLSPVFIVIKDDTKTSGVNVITVSYISVLSENPPIIGIAIRPKRYSSKLLFSEMEFTLNIPTIKQLADLDYCGSVSGRIIDKINQRKITLSPAEQIKTPIIKDCPINLECQVIRTLGPDDFDSSHYFFIAKVVHATRDNNFSIDDAEILATTNYQFRLVTKQLGEAYKTWRQKKED